MKKKVIVIFDIGKTNKKILLFNTKLKVVYEKEEKFQTTVDEDGDECENLELIEKWIINSLLKLIKSRKYDIAAVNFSTYGASLVFLGKNGKRLTPIYNYLKKIPIEIQDNLFDQYGGKAEFCRKTASPALGLLLNSGIQINWLRQTHPEIFKNTSSILHFPQYLCYLLTKNKVSESTSIGCHTFMWDFDNNAYHQWMNDQGISLPEPIPNNHTISVEIEEEKISVGIGIHDSSASLAPYIRGSKENFLLVSTGTWCINMNPFNHTPLTSQELEKDCLCYLSINQKPVKSSRLFMGHIHDVNVKRLANFFNVPEYSYKKIAVNEKLITRYLATGKSNVFFRYPIPTDYIDVSVNLSQFKDFTEAYHRLMYDLTLLNCESIDLISKPDDDVKKIYVSGGFARNEIFVRLLSNFYPKKEVFTSQVNNSSAMGAALVVWHELGKVGSPSIDLGLKIWKPFKV